MNSLLTNLGVKLPIIQAPMAGVSTPEMAATVSNAGAPGVNRDRFGRQRDRATNDRCRSALSQRPFNVNVFCHQPAVADERKERAWIAQLASEFARFGAKPPNTLREIYQSFNADNAKLAVLLEERPAIVSFHFGLPPHDQIADLRRAGIKLLSTATNLEEAIAAAAAGVDAVVAQGYEAGGHRGMFDPNRLDDALSTMALTRLLVIELDLPVIAAGGIMDGAGVAAAIALGAEGAQLGDRVHRLPGIVRQRRLSCCSV